MDYPNLLGFFAGNEIINEDADEDVPAYIRVSSSAARREHGVRFNLGTNFIYIFRLSNVTLKTTLPNMLPVQFQLDTPLLISVKFLKTPGTTFLVNLKALPAPRLTSSVSTLTHGAVMQPTPLADTTSLSKCSPAAPTQSSSLSMAATRSPHVISPRSRLSMVKK